MNETLSDNNNRSYYLRAYDMPGLVVYGNTSFHVQNNLLRLSQVLSPSLYRDEGIEVSKDYGTCPSHKVTTSNDRIRQLNFCSLSHAQIY